jgi:hypothetical protein
MRKLLLLFTSAILALGLVGSASAAKLNYQGTTIILLGEFGTGFFTGGGVATVNGSGGEGHLNQLRLAASRGVPGGEFTTPVTDPETVGNGIGAIQFVGVEGGTGTLGNISGGASSNGNLSPNTFPLRGLVKICLLSTACDQGSLNLILTQTTTVPPGVKGAGIGGLVTIGGQGAIRMSIVAAPWTIKTATVVDDITTAVSRNRTFLNITMKGFAHGPLSGTTSTANVSGVVQVVTPNQVRTNLPQGSNLKVSAAVSSVIHFVPEPGLLLLLGSGVTGLALLGRRRLRK